MIHSRRAPGMPCTCGSSDLIFVSSFACGSWHSCVQCRSCQTHGVVDSDYTQERAEQLALTWWDRSREFSLRHAANKEQANARTSAMRSQDDVPAGRVHPG
jgi:hypothetical protein